MSSAAAVPPGSNTRALVGRIARARDSFLTSGVASGLLRPVIAESWQRSLSLGLDPQTLGPPVELDGGDLQEYRTAHPLAAVMPVVRRLLVDQATEAGLLVAVSDHDGRLLWVEGAPSLRRRAERMTFVEGARWSEAEAGTNAPGTALALGQAVQIFAAEHLASVATDWSCTAAPVHGPDGRVVGAIDITGGDDVAGLPAMLLVRATVAAVEAELRAVRSTRGPRFAAASLGVSLGRGRAVRPSSVTVPRLEVLGQRGGTAAGRLGITQLRPRHAELILLLTAHPDGLNGDRLGILMNDHRTAPVTLRADLSRLRTVLAELGDLRLATAPYRLVGDLVTDYQEVRRLLGTGAVRRAVLTYRGPVLPNSSAPGVEDLRAELARQVTACVLASADPDLVWSFANRPDVSSDLDVWRACRALLPARSPRRPLVDARIRLLDLEYG